MLRFEFRSIAIITGACMALFSCQPNHSDMPDFTGNEVQLELIPGTVEGNTTTGALLIRERTDGKAQLEITLEGVLPNAEHPVHLHFGSLDDNGEIATYLTTLREEKGIGKSVTLLNTLDGNTLIDYDGLLVFSGSIKIHFEASGPLKDAILGAVDIGLNSHNNQAYLTGLKSITSCNSDFRNN